MLYRIIFDQILLAENSNTFRAYSRHVVRVTYKDASMSPLKKVPTGLQRPRRKIGAIGRSAVFSILTTTRLAAATNGNREADNGQGGQCFLKGTNSRTTEGDRKVEDLSLGDLLLTVFVGICPIRDEFRSRKWTWFPLSARGGMALRRQFSTAFLIRWPRC